jgi:hypothetical protein
MFEPIPQDFTVGFIIGLVFGIIIGSVIAEVLFYLYWKREFYPLWEFYQGHKLEQKLKEEQGLK